VEELKERLARRFGDLVARYVIFGSWARGEAHEHSDVDLLVSIRDIDEAAEVWMDTGVRIAPLVMSEDRLWRLLGLERLIARDIEREGIPL